MVGSLTPKSWDLLSIVNYHNTNKGLLGLWSIENFLSITYEVSFVTNWTKLGQIKDEIYNSRDVNTVGKHTLFSTF